MAEETIEAYPLTWPVHVPRTKVRERATFGQRTSSTHRYFDGTASVHHSKAALTIEQGRRRVDDELRRLGARDVVISSNLVLRLDGAPKSGQRAPEDPGVAVYFKLRGEPHCMPCDRWDRAADNLAAIAKHVESLRGQLRWGVVDVAQAFAGFKALPPKGATSEGSASPPWWNVLGVKPDDRLEVIEAAFKALAFKMHPDRGGDAGAMAMITRAREEARAARA